MIQKIIKAKLIEIGQIKKSVNWTNIYLKFRDNNGKELWFYYSEHVSKPQRLKQIRDFEDEKVCKVGMNMDVSYEIKQSENKSTTLNIKSLANYQLK
jgi:hypothetical protein